MSSFRFPGTVDVVRTCSRRSDGGIFGQGFCPGPVGFDLYRWGGGGSLTHPAGSRRPSCTAAPTAPAPASTSSTVDFSYLGDYANSGLLTDAQIVAAAQKLGCHPGLVYAIAKQESGKSSFLEIDGHTVPTILYERHWFRRFTKVHHISPYEKTDHDICGAAYVEARHDKKHHRWLNRLTGEVVAYEDAYGEGGRHQYEKLTKAYRLDKAAALKSCSWGAFQIMGFNHHKAGFATVFDFVKRICKGEAENLLAFLSFAKSVPILAHGLRHRLYDQIAQGHNGDNWRKVNPDYASNLKKFFEEYVANHPEKKKP